MPERTNLIYCYDGSFDGLLCCVFESYDRDEMPADILLDSSSLPFLLPIKHITTLPARAQRVLVSIPKKMGRDALDFLRRAFLTCHPQRDMLILEFLRIGYQAGPSVMRMLTHPTLHTLFGAVRHLENEAHLLLGLVRFSEFNGALVAQIEPKNKVLPLIAPHFCDRYANEQFLIHDKTHHMALLYAEHSWFIHSVDQLTFPSPSEEERKLRALWRIFYDTIEIRERRNPKCRMGHMPKRYWGCMTEFQTDEDMPATTAILPLTFERPQHK